MLASSSVETGSSVVFNNPDQTSGGAVGTYKGRRFVPRDKIAAKTPAAGRLKIPKNVNLEGLHQAMEEDSRAVDVLKREVCTGA